MSERAALILGGCIIVAAVIFALSTRYEGGAAGEASIYRFDRWTGEMCLSTSTRWTGKRVWDCKRSVARWPE